MNDLLARLKQRKPVQWSIAYVAFAFALIQVLDVVAGSYHWPDRAMHVVFGLLVLGFVIALVLAWYHGEKGRQRVSGAELLLLALVLAIGGGLLWRFGRSGSHAPVTTAAQGAGARVISASNVASASSVSTLRAMPASPVAVQPIPAKSIAVLPFENLSGDSNEKYFSDGITEEILNALAQIPDLKVAGRTSAFQFTSKDENPRTVGTVLGVANLLEGSVQKSGDEVRITVQLIDAHTGYQRWSEKYDRKLTNIFAIEDDISNAIAGKLRVQLTGGGGQALVAQQVVDPRAHDFYLRGLTLLAARGPGLRDAVAAFQSAVKIAPDYAQAWGTLANAEALLPNYRLQDKTALARAQSFAKRALALNADTASAYGALGIVYIERWQWAKGEQAFRHSLALAPNDAEAVDQYAQFLFAAGQFKPALAEIERAQRLDPLSAVIATIRAWLLFVLQRSQEATTQISSTLAAHPDFALAHSIAVMIDVHGGRFTQALAQARSSLRPNATVLLVRGMADPAMRDQAVHEMETSPTFSALRTDPLVFAQYLTLLGAHGHAMDVLESLTEDQATSNPQEIWDPSLDPIRNDPRFKAVLKKMGLPYTPKDATAP